jgi:hypothetical protein
VEMYNAMNCGKQGVEGLYNLCLASISVVWEMDWDQVLEAQGLKKRSPMDPLLFSSNNILISESLTY